MQTFIKSNGLKEIGRSKIRNYDSIACVQAAIDSGELKENDLFTTIAAHGITEDLEAVIHCLVSITPSSASPVNMLVTQDQLSVASDITALTTRVTNAETNISDNATEIASNTGLINQLGARTGVNETNICNLQDCKFDTATFNTFYNGEFTSLVTDYNSQIACRVECCDFTSYQGTISTALTNIDTNYQALATRVCTAEGDIDNLESCPGLNCVGTLTGVTLNGTNQTVSNGVAALKAVTAVCNSLDQTLYPVTNQGVAVIKLPSYSLSGTVLTITV